MKMNPICPYCKVPLKTKFRSWIDRRFGTVDVHAGRFWECPSCKRLWKKGYGIIERGTEVKKR